VPDAERVIRRGRFSPRTDLHVDSCRFRLASTLVLDEQLFDDASQKADARLALPGPDEDTATYLVEDRGRALRRGWIDNVSLECADGGGLSVQPVTRTVPIVSAAAILTASATSTVASRVVNALILPGTHDEETADTGWTMSR
jgi:hypothetical protein